MWRVLRTLWEAVCYPIFVPDLMRTTAGHHCPQCGCPSRPGQWCDDCSADLAGD